MPAVVGAGHGLRRQVLGFPCMGDLRVRAAVPGDRPAIVDQLTASWGGTVVVGHSTVYDAAELPALLAERDGELVGLLTYSVAEDAAGAADGLEVVTIDAAVRHSGAGSALLAAAAETARRAARALKPSIPVTGAYGIALHDELTLGRRL